VLGPLVDTPFNGGPATWKDDIELIVHRHGFNEESHFTIAYSPVPDETAPLGIGGVLGVVMEITEKVIGQRRVEVLRELGAVVADAKTDVHACKLATKVLAQCPKDVPFALSYLLDNAEHKLRLVSSTGIDAALTGPEILDASGPMSEVVWPLAEALRTEAIQMRDGLASLIPSVPQGPWPYAPDSVAVIPIRSNVTGRPAGALVVGISACIRLDQLYLSFLSLVGSQIATAVANTRAYEEERHRAKALAEINRAKTVFFSNVSHEFRTPLTLMLGPLDDAAAAEGVPPRVRSEIDVAQRNAQRLLKLVNSLLDFARIEAGRIQASYAPVDLAALTADLASTFRSAMERAGLEFDVDCRDLGEPIYVDREMWERVVLNLLSNAFKFTLRGGVRVRLVREGGAAVLEVADTGRGIAEHDLPRLFERFFRAEGGESRTHEGSGIGLALVHELVKLHGGSIDAESELGRGTTFRVRIPFGNAHLPQAQLHFLPSSAASSAQVYVQEALSWLPASEGEPTSHVAAVVEGDPGKRDRRFAATFNSRVLLADDNADMRAYVVELLGPIYRVEAVVDGAQALAAARRDRPDLVISDVMMPNVDGFALLKALRADQALRDVPVILLSARAGEEARIEGFGAGADDYIVKPFYARELLARVGGILELTRLRRDSEERFRAFVQATSDAVYRMNADWTELLALEGRDFIADQIGPTRSWMSKYVREDDRERVTAAISEAIRTRKPFELEHPVVRADGTIGWTFSRAIPLFDADGTIVEWFGAASDVTVRHENQDELERRQRELEEADRQKNEFLAMLAHELRNPLAPIRNASELLVRKLSADPDACRSLALVNRQVAHLTRLVDDLLDISRITQRRIELYRSPTKVADVIARALETTDPVVRERHHRVAIVSSRRPLMVNADPERLVQCLANILINAAKYSNIGGEIRIESRTEGDQVVISVSDNGVGIAPELLPNVFDLFVQGERTLDRSQGGLGIGLSIVKRLIEMHGGTVGVASDGVNRGATFEIRLPLTDAAQAAADSVHVGSPAALKILVVDDNQDAADSLGDLLRLDGHDVDTAYSGLDVLERIRSWRPAVVLLDIGLPGVDGYEVASRVHADPNANGTKLVALTGYGQDTHREKASAAGFVAHLVKPVEYAALQRVIAQVAAK